MLTEYEESVLRRRVNDLYLREQILKYQLRRTQDLMMVTKNTMKQHPVSPKRRAQLLANLRRAALSSRITNKDSVETSH